jgi:ligand-binding sensor domain-containing protein/signal transduction histidine kinase
MNNIKKIALLALLFVFALFLEYTLLFSQSLTLKYYSRKDGLPDNSITRIIQDSRGFLWFGTGYGLSRFDGKEFRNFPDEKHGVKNEYILGLFEDRKGDLWIGTKKYGLIRMSLDGVVYKIYTTRDGLPDNKISSITEDRDGKMWLGTRSGICVFDGNTFTVYSKKDGLIDNSVNAVLFDRSWNLWIGTDKGLSCLTAGTQNGKRRFINLSHSSDFINDSINALMLDHSGNIWIGTNGGLYSCHIDNERPVFTCYSTKNGMADDAVYTIMEDRNRDIWIGTRSGVSFFSSGKFTNYYGKNGFPDDRILDIIEDREGNIWIGTQVAGARRLQPLRITNFTDKDGLPSNLIWAVLEEKEGEYWIGTDKGLSRYSDGKFKNYTTKDGLINNSIYYLLKNREGNIWIGAEGGISVYSPQKGKFTNYTANDGLQNEFVLTLAEGKDGTIWIGATDGLRRFSEGRIKPPGLDVKPERGAVHAILQDKKDNLWFSDTKVLWKISGKKSTYYSVKDGLMSESIYSLMEDSTGGIWIATNAGMNCFRNGKFTRYSISDGLSGNDCFSLAEDDNHKIWIGTRNGINRFDGKTFKTYTSKDGLISDEINQKACIKDSRGDMWFGTASGISRFNPRYDREKAIAPPVYITQLSVMGKELPIPVPGNIRLKYDEKNIKIGFSGIYYTSPEDIVYKHRLEDWEREWIEIQDRSVSYSSLPPGDYTFKVIARNRDGVESTTPATLRITILPPFWLTWWFITLSGMFLIFPVMLIIKIQNKWVKKRMENEAKTKQLVMAQRMKLMGVLAGGAVHDLKNLLTIILGYSGLVNDTSQDVSEDEKSEAIEIIISTADTAFQVVNQILAFSRQTYDDTKEFDLVELLNEILSILKITIPRTIEITWEPPKDSIFLAINPVKFKQVIMNLCLNAVQAMGERGELKILLVNDPGTPDRIFIEVSDTGPGIKPEFLDKIFDPLFTTKGEEKGSGLGLFVVKQVIDEYKGKITVSSKQGEGTTFKIYFPVLKHNDEID